jgi:heptose-I-phosphate ethanolaminephosphotransferase
MIAQNLQFKSLAPGIIACTVFAVLIFWMSSFLSTKWLKILYASILVTTLLPSVILLGYLLSSNVWLTPSSIVSLFETNPHESKEFVEHYISPLMTAGIILYVMCPVIMIIKIKNIRFRKITDHKNLFAMCIVLFLFLGFEPVAQRLYFIDFYKSFTDYKIRSEYEEKAVSARQDDVFEVITEKDKAPRTIVFILGESLSKHHMSLYGYARKTNPLLESKQSELMVFNDVVAPQVHTLHVLRSVLTFADRDHPNYIIEKPSLFELFNRAGYETHLITNQPFDEASTSYEMFLELAQNKTDLSKRGMPDGILLTTVINAIKKKSDKPKFIMIHLMGSHMFYENRYPDSYNRFAHRNDHVCDSKSGYMNEKDKEILDQYDNTVLYNDYFISAILDELKKKEQSSVMLYCSDHGEEVFDFQNYAGHSYDKVSTYMCDVPFVLWLSKDFKYRRDDLVFNTERAYSTADLIYTFSEIAGLSYMDYDGKRSILSKDFVERNRFVGDMTYERVQTNTLNRKYDQTNNYYTLKFIPEKIKKPLFLEKYF